MFTIWQAVAFLACAVITFASYQSIPEELERLARKRRGAQIVKLLGERTFTIFIRWCGTDHMIMALAMFAMAAGLHVMWMGWVVVASAACVAAISALTAAGIYFEARK